MASQSADGLDADPHPWPRRGIVARPVAIPDDIDEPRTAPVGGRVILPPNVSWSGTPRVYDLDSQADSISVYEQVLQEGTVDDVRAFIDLDRLIELWDDLVLPPHVRLAWAHWISEHRGLDLAC
ncbi:MAG: hypothetical protein ACYCTI_02600 [Acidimicrobiales bacterium]